VEYMCGVRGAAAIEPHRHVTPRAQHRLPHDGCRYGVAGEGTDQRPDKARSALKRGLAAVKKGQRT